MLAEQYQLRCKLDETAAWEYFPGTSIDTIHPNCRILYARGTHFRTTDFNPRELINLMQPIAHQLNG